MSRIERRGAARALALLCALVLGLSGLAGAARAQAAGGGGGGLGDAGYGGSYPGYETSCDGGCGEAASVPAGVVRLRVAPGGRTEFVILGPESEAGTVAAIVDEVGGSVIRSASLGALGLRSQIATFPGAAARDRAQALIGARAAGSALAPHHLYRFAQAGRGSPRIYAPALIGDAAPGRCRVPGTVTIGLIDGPVNTEHPALAGVEVVTESTLGTMPPVAADHGTAVAALLAGQDAGGALAGFASGARLHAIAVFGQTDAGEEASIEHIAEAIDRLLRRDVRLINMSFAGPENAALGRALAAASARGAVLIAAAGNDNRPQVAWPAAAPEVIAVTAIDAARRRFALANTGDEIEFAAPGVDVYAARARGAGYVSGTSFAAPIVTALAARHMARGIRAPDRLRARLQADVEALGQGGRNREFGWGLVKSAGC